MTLRETMERWLESGTPEQQAHARFRLTQPFNEPTYPPIATQIGNAISAAGTVLADALAGKTLRVPPEEHARRLAICTGADSAPACRWYDAAKGKCRACGCNADWKARLSSSSCPKGFW